MKKLLFILTFFVLTISVNAQFTKPTGVTPITGYTIFYNPADSTMTVCWGNPQKCNTFVQKFDTTKLAGWVNNRKLLSYRQIADSVLKDGTVSNYKLLHKIDSIMGLVKYRNDSILPSGFYTNYKASIGSGFVLPNNTWTQVYDAAGNITNGWKKSKDNIFEFAGILGINKFYHVQNSGVNEIVSIPLSVDSPTGTEHGVEIAVGTNKIMKVSAKVSATGIADSTRVTLSSGTMLGFGKSAKASIDIEAGTATRAPIQMASGDTTGINKAGAIGYNGTTYYGHDGTGLKHFAYVNDSIYSSEIASNGQNNIYIGFKLKNNTKVFYNNNFLEPSRWSGVGKDTISLNLNTMLYDHLFIHN